METKEGNKLIAEFMGIKLPTAYSLILSYHTSWDWLMPVVEKIGFTPNIKCSKIEAVWLAVVEFIIWNNQQKKV